MGELGEIGKDDGRVGADVVLRPQFLQRRCGVSLHQGLEEIDDAHAIGKAEHLLHVLGAHDSCRMGNRLIEQRKRIAHRAFCGARDKGERRRLRLYLFFGGNAFEVLHQQRGVDAAQIEALTARQHRHRHLADLSGGEDELGVRRRLFQRLQQRVERLGGQHVHFIENVDLVARGDWRIANGIVNLAHVIDAVVGGGVHLQNVDVPAFHDRLVVDAHHRHVDGRLLHRAVG